MEISVEHWQGWDIVRIEGAFVLRNLNLARPVFKGLEKKGTTKAALDLSKIQLVDSSAISLIVNFRAALEKHDGTLAILEANEEIRAIFSVLGLEDAAILYGSRVEFEKDATSGVI